MKFFQLPHILPKAFKTIHKTVQNIYIIPVNKSARNQKNIGKGYTYYGRF